mmetsp:Transcript_12491/g.21328  ORF Transcript_12491/g.21328 Transcript_12491/m.21328 type:complete len:317 (-) Transcript_12491:125-1075(-)|eukprot:CAMPEP_0184702768 /NCGR_PEP_ID=MMETSP0313-20130426/25426_1 /TAXON_ID=2792 /ORGANISM="Porphyridium aerugineum, Strain SAG 1380-2" /LENGTH=316 /DNA_ID=CAMNT_0027163343 /DNA_START=69 /DNA_END=1019 /DNA_ORIENTATION=+
MEAFIPTTSGLSSAVVKPMHACKQHQLQARPTSRITMMSIVHNVPGAPDFTIKFDDMVPANTEFAKKHNNLRNREVRPVSETLRDFFASYARPIPTVYSTLVNETITTTHLSVYHYAFHYDAVFAFGFRESFERFFGFFPDAQGKDRLFHCMVSALKLDEKKLMADYTAVKSWAAPGRTLEEFYAVIDGSSKDTSCPQLNDAFRVARDCDKMEFHISRMFALGVMYLLEMTAGKATHAEADDVAKRMIGKSSFFIKDAMDQYRGGMEKLKAAEQLFAEIAARDKKKLAERLADKAKKAVEEAEKAEKEAAAESVSK